MALSKGKKRKSETNEKSRKRAKSNRTADDQTIVENAQISAGPTEKQKDPLERQRKVLAYKSFLNRGGPDAPGSKTIPRGADGCLRSLTFVITGVLPSLERDECKKLIENYSGRVTTAVSGKTDFLIVGRDGGKTKIEKAKKLGIKSICEDDLLTMIGTRAENKNIENPKKREIRSKIIPKKIEIPIEEKTSVDNLLWTEKYKPNSLNELVGQQTERSPMKKLIYFLSNWNISKRRAVLLVGPSGSGKTTTARLVCKALNISYIENELTSSHFVDEREKRFSKQALIIDEIQNQSFPMLKIIEYVKNTSIPIILISNDSSSTEFRKLNQFCEEIRFQRASLLNIKSRLMEICSNERIRITHQELDRIIELCHRDLRKILLTLHFYCKQSSTILTNFIKSERLLPSNPFDAVTKLFSTKNLTLNEKSNLYFYDRFLMPLLIHENYLRVVPSDFTRRLDLISRTADSLAVGDLFSKLIRTDSNRTSYSYEAMFLGVLPPTYLHGTLSTMHENHMTETIDTFLHKLATDFKSAPATINGVLVTDKNGLLLASHEVKHDSNGTIALLSELASTLLERPAIVSLENEEQKLIVREAGKTVFAIYAEGNRR